MNKCRTNTQLQLGSEKDSQGAATEFELAIARYLDSQGVAYIPEAAQPRGCHVLTPDFRLSTPVEIGGQAVNWLEAKNFYCAATIKQVLALSCLASTKKSVDFGPGKIPDSLLWGRQVVCGRDKGY